MTEYWVSQARYYCKFCKCWMTDKKITRENHDKGSRHKQAYKEYFDKIKKEKLDQAKADSEVLAELKEIERAANQQYAQDITKGYAAAAPEDPNAKRQQYFYYGNADEAFVSAQSEEKARLEAFYQQQLAGAHQGYGTETAATAVDNAQAVVPSEEDPGLLGDAELQAIIARKQEMKRQHEEEEERKRAEEERDLEEKKKRAGPYGMWTVVDKSEIEAREQEQQRLTKRQKTSTSALVPDDSSDSDVEEDDRIAKKEEADDPALVVEFKKRTPAGGRGRGRRPPLRKKLDSDEEN